MQTELDARYGEPEVDPVGWPAARALVEQAELYWIHTVRSDGRPHVTPLIGVWVDDAWWFTTGAEEQKAKNLRQNAHIAATTGTNTLHSGTDVVLEGQAVRETDPVVLQRVADAYFAKYGEEWHFGVGDGVFTDAAGTGEALVFRVAPSTAYAFGKEPYSHTRYTF